jgi:cell wall-associated NlpC family hydrolase
LRSHIVWNAAAAALLLLVLPVIVAADQPDTSAQPPQELVVKLDTSDPGDIDPSVALSSQGSLLDNVCGLATGFLGTPYRWGGTTPKAFDCSGFVRYVYAELGVKLPRTARQQIKVGQKVSGAMLQAGDLIFFDMMKGYVSHVGMYLGNGKFIHASTPRTGVRIDPLSKYSKHLVGARRYVS